MHLSDSAPFQVRENLASLDVETEALAEIMVCCGFFLIYFVEEIVHTCIGSQLNEYGCCEANVKTSILSFSWTIPPCISGLNRLRIQPLSPAYRHLYLHMAASTLRAPAVLHLSGMYFENIVKKPECTFYLQGGSTGFYTRN